MNKKKLMILLIFSLIFLGILSSKLAAATQKIKIQKENGIEVIYNPKKPEPPTGTLTKLILEEELAIGQGPGEATFFRLVSFTVDNQGTIYALDSKDCVVKVFDSQGKFLRSFGQKGQGPGEMNNPTGIHLTPAGGIMIEDPVNQRLAYFSSDGKFLRTVSTAKVFGLFGFIMGIMLDSKGNLIGRQVAITENKMVLELKKYNPDLSALYTVDSSDFLNPLEGKINPFKYVWVYALNKNDYLYYGKPDKYEIHVFNPEGNLIRKIIKEWEPVRITQDEKKELLSKIPDVGFGLKDRIVIQDYFPPYEHFSIDEEGRLFVRTFERATTKNEYCYDIFDNQGRYIARISLKFVPHIWKNKKLYALEEIEEGSLILRCFRFKWQTSTFVIF